MERNDPMMQEWKREMKNIKLSQQRRAKIEQSVLKVPAKRFTPVKIVLPFALAIMAILVFAGMPQITDVTTTSTEKVTLLQPLNGKLITWATLAMLFVITNYCLLVAVVQKVPRIQHLAFFEAFKSRMNKKQFWQIALMTLLLVELSWLFVLLLPSGIIFVQIFVALQLVPFTTFIQLLVTRNDEWPICAHCGEVVSRKTLRKRNWGGTPICEHCGEKLYVDGKKLNKAYIVNLPAPLIIIMPQVSKILEIEAIPALIFAYTCILYISMRHISPYTTKFTTDDKIPPLW